MNNKYKYLISWIVSLIFFLSIGQVMLIIFSIFLISFSYREKLQIFTNKIKLKLIIKLIILMALIWIITEILAIWNNVGLSNEEIIETKKLLSANPFEDLILSFGYYVPIAFVWNYLFKKYDYSIWDSFITMWIFWICFEWWWLILLTFNPVFWAYTFIVHGSYLWIASVFIKNDSNHMIQASILKIKKYLYWFLALTLITIPYILWYVFINAIIS